MSNVEPRQIKNLRELGLSDPDIYLGHRMRHRGSGVVGTVVRHNARPQQDIAQLELVLAMPNGVEIRFPRTALERVP